jgi:NAD(P)-dependent dehydrogenase (short-subunit alcohol dehydrogenase family)
VSRTILITGSTDGLGRELARRAHREGWQVLAHGRSEERLGELAGELEGIRTLRADLASLAEVAGLAGAVEEAAARLDVLVNNAGIGFTDPGDGARMESADGHELRFAVNYLAGFVLTLRLLPLLRRSAPARIVNVASLGQSPTDFDDPQLERGYSGTRAYGQSKLAQISFGFELAQRLGSEPITVTSLHPATFMPTKIVLEEVGHSIDTLEEGVESTVRLATAPELEGVTRSFFDRQAEATPHAQAYDPDARRRLWNLSAELAGEDVSRLFPHASSERE